MGGGAGELIGTEDVKSDGCSDKGDKAGNRGIPGSGIGFDGDSYSSNQSHSMQLDLYSSCLPRRSRGTKMTIGFDMASNAPLNEHKPYLATGQSTAVVY